MKKVWLSIAFILLAAWLVHAETFEQYLALRPNSTATRPGDRMVVNQGGVIKLAPLAPVASSGAYNDLTGRPNVVHSSGNETIGGFKNFTTGIIAVNVISKGPVVDFQSFGALGDTITDDAAALNTALQFLVANGGYGVIDIPNVPGKHWTWKSVPKIPLNLSGQIAIRGVGKPTITMTATGFQLWGIPSSYMYYDYCRNIEISGLVIDMNNVQTNSHIIIGNRSAGVDAMRLNWDSIYVHDVQVINAHATATGTWAMGVLIASVHSASNEITQTTITNIQIERTEMHGGTHGFIVYGNVFDGGAQANVWLDNINLVDCAFFPAPTDHFYASTGAHVGLYGLGGKVRITRFRCENPGDNAIEINNMADARMTDCYAKNCYVDSYLSKNYRPVPYPNAQHIIWDNCNTIIDNWQPQITSFLIDGVYNGHISILNSSVSKINDGKFTNAGCAIQTYGSAPAVAKSLTVKNLKVNWTVNASEAIARYPSAFRMQFTSSYPVNMDNINVYISGTTDVSNYYPRMMDFNGPCELHLSRLYLVSDITTGLMSGIMFGGSSATTPRGTISDYKFRSAASGRGIELRTANVTLDGNDMLILSKCDFLGTNVGLYYNPSAPALLPYVVYESVVDTDGTIKNSAVTTPAYKGLSLGGFTTANIFDADSSLSGTMFGLRQGGTNRFTVDNGGSVVAQGSFTSNGGNNVLQTTDTATSGERILFQLHPTYNQTTGTASNVTFDILRSETALGSGSQYFIRGRVGSTVKWLIDNNGYFMGNVVTQTTGDNTDSPATTKFVNASIAAIPANNNLMIWGGRSEGSATAVGQTGAQVTLNSSITIYRLQAFAITQAASCSTSPVLSIYDATASSIVASVTLSNGTQNFDSGALTVVVPSGHSIMPRWTTAGVGCSPAPSGIDFTVQYKMQ